jgi:putative hydroxymethylpyrimidine transport system permease protein
MNIFYRAIILLSGMIFIWQILVTFFNLPPYILPSPLQVLKTIYTHRFLIGAETLPTVIETLLGLVLGIVIGCITACVMAFFRPATIWLLPVLISNLAWIWYVIENCYNDFDAVFSDYECIF